MFGGFQSFAIYNSTLVYEYLNEMWFLRLCECDFGVCILSANTYCNCTDSFYGPSCNGSCSCVNGDCDVLNGSCSCDDNYYGLTCNGSCSCVNGNCNALNGSCSCAQNYYGLSCNSSCSCVYGNCDHLNGSCYCFNGYNGIFCDQKCIDFNCTILCSCTTSNCSQQNTCNNNITITNQNITIIPETYYQFLGNVVINESNIDLNSVQLSLSNNISFSESTITFKSSSIIAKGCITLSNTKFIVDLSNSTSTSNLLLMNSTLGCLSGTYSMKFENQPKCSELKSELNSYSLLVLFTKTDCNNSQTLTLAASIIWIYLIFLLS